MQPTRRASRWLPQGRGALRHRRIGSSPTARRSRRQAGPGRACMEPSATVTPGSCKASACPSSESGRRWHREAPAPCVVSTVLRSRRGACWARLLAPRGCEGQGATGHLPTCAFRASAASACVRMGQGERSHPSESATIYHEPSDGARRRGHPSESSTTVHTAPPARVCNRTPPCRLACPTLLPPPSPPQATLCRCCRYRDQATYPKHVRVRPRQAGPARAGVRKALSVKKT